MKVAMAKRNRERKKGRKEGKKKQEQRKQKEKKRKKGRRKKSNRRKEGRKKEKSERKRNEKGEKENKEKMEKKERKEGSISKKEIHDDFNHRFMLLTWMVFLPDAFCTGSDGTPGKGGASPKGDGTTFTGGFLTSRPLRGNGIGDFLCGVLWAAAVSSR